MSPHYSLREEPEEYLSIISMAADGDDIFVYLGGDQEVPMHITHAVIDPSVNIVRRGAFEGRRQLVSVIFHDGLEIVEEYAFLDCVSLREIKLLGVREIRDEAFRCCYALSDVEFGDRLEIIGMGAFTCCSLSSIKMPSVRTVQFEAFRSCTKLFEAEFGIDLETIGVNSFIFCDNLERVAIPLKYDLFSPDPIEQQYNQFDDCRNLRVVELVGAEGIHNTISSLLIESWKDEMNDEIDRINQELPDTPSRDKANSIRLWIRSVIDGMDHYKAEHNRLLNEHMTQLELAVWKAKLDDKEEDSIQSLQAMMIRVNIDEERSREEMRITSGADTIIKNVLPFLKLL